jgi:hypothetical protein
MQKSARSWMLGAACAVVGSQALAELVTNSVPVDILAVGGICDLRSDETLKAPQTSSGTVGHNFYPFRYVADGDLVAAAEGMGVGLRARVGRSRPGQTVTLQITYPDGFTSRWEGRIGDGREIEFGGFPASGSTMQGIYRLAVLRGDQTLFSYDIIVTDVTDAEHCPRLIS